MLNLRKFPLFILVVPFLAGAILEYFTQWPAKTVLIFPFVTLLTSTAIRLNYRRTEIPEEMRAFLLITAFFSIGILAFQVNDYRHFEHSIGSQLNKQVTVTGEILEVKKGIGGRQQVLVEVNQLVQGDSVEYQQGKIVADVMDDEQVLHTGEIIALAGELKASENKNNPGEFDAVYFYRNRKISGHVFVSGDAVQKLGERHSLNYWLVTWRDYLAAKMETELDGQFLAISKALILGDKSDLDTELMSSFSSTGAMHVLAVSGLHIGLILVLLQKVLQLFARRISKRQGIFIAIVLIWLYGGLTGASPSVMRAVVMFSILSGAQLMGRQNHSLNVLALSAILLLTFDPWMLFDLGFQLSYAAMLGIFLLYRPIADAWAPRNKLLQLTWEGTAVGIVATILTMPLTLYWFYQFPNYFALANLGVMVFGFAVLMLGLVFLVSSWIPFVIKIVAVIFSFSILALVYWVAWVDELPGAVSGGFHLQKWEMIAAYGLITGWIIHLNQQRINRLVLITCSMALAGWWSFQRSQVLQQNQLIIFNSNQFVAVVKKGATSYGFYDQKWNGSWKEPRELQSYAKYSGTTLKVFPFKRDELTMTGNGVNIRLNKGKTGISIQFNNDSLHYRTMGTPAKTENKALMTTRLQLYANPGAETVPFIRGY